jgi:hypothetical protein
MWVATLEMNKHHYKYKFVSDARPESKAENCKATKKRKAMKKKPGFKKKNRFGALGAKKRCKQVKFNIRKIKDPAAADWYREYKKWGNCVRFCLALGHPPPAPFFSEFPGGYVQARLRSKREVGSQVKKEKATDMVELN